VELAARADAEKAARDEVAAVYAAAVEAIVLAQVAADEKIASVKAAATAAVARAHATGAEAKTDGQALTKAVAGVQTRSNGTVGVQAASNGSAGVQAASNGSAGVQAASNGSAGVQAGSNGSAVVHDRPNRSAGAPARPADTPTAPVTDHRAVRPFSPAGATRAAAAPAQADDVGLAKVSPLASRPAQIEPWVQATGRTVAEATESALAQLGVGETDAEIEVLSRGSRWIPGRVQVRARIRPAEGSCA
jgi:hypothetical protein